MGTSEGLGAERKVRDRLLVGATRRTANSHPGRFFTATCHVEHYVRLGRAPS
jgi:hypothetical protein